MDVSDTLMRHQPISPDLLLPISPWGNELTPSCQVCPSAPSSCRARQSYGYVADDQLRGSG
jgi:hypothetical protein